MMPNNAGRLTESILAVCPIDGVSIGKDGDTSTVEIQFRNDATREQREAAALVLKEFDWSEEADARYQALKDMQAAVTLLESTDPVAQAVRVLMRVIVDSINVRLRTIKLEPILEDDIKRTLAEYIQQGYSLP